MIRFTHSTYERAHVGGVLTIWWGDGTLTIEARVRRTVHLWRWQRGDA